MSDVAEAIDEEAEAVTLRVRGAATYNARGVAVPGELVSRSIRAAIQPAEGRKLQDLPEGIRNDVAFLGWSREPVAEGNEIIYGDTTLRVVQAWPRPRDGFTKFALTETGHD